MSQALLGDCLLRPPEARAALGASSGGGRLGEGQRGELSYSRWTLYLLDSSNWHRGDLNTGPSDPNSKAHSSMPELSLHHPIPAFTPSPGMTPRSCFFDLPPSPAQLTGCPPAWFTGKNMELESPLPAE